MVGARAAGVMLAAALGGCGGDPGAAPTSDTTASSETTAIASASETSSSGGLDVTTDASVDASSGLDSSGTSGDPGDPPWQWDLPPGFPEPWVPADNPMSAAKVELGRHLFYDERMSGHGAYACATCHLQELAFTDGRTTAIGETGQIHRRNAMGLTNVAYNTTLTWAHPLLVDLERQALVPMFGDDPIELGIDSEDELIAALAVEPTYGPLFADAFPDDPDPMTAAHVVQALSVFQRTIISGRSAFDRWFAGDASAISESAQRGYELFNGHPFECFHCHLGFNLSDATYWDPQAERAPIFHNTGLYNVDGDGAYPSADQGLIELTLEPTDMGKFRVPSLRNVAVTGPYMHDGSIATLDEVLDHYAAGGRTISTGPNAGIGSESPRKDPLVSGFTATAEQRADLLAFLDSLTDHEFLTDPGFSNPWE